MKTLAYSIFTAAGITLAGGVQAQQDYPNKPVRIVYPFAAGGGGDLVSRTLAAELGRDLKETFIIDNRTGGNGNIGTDIVARANPDGYTLLVTTNATIVINPQLFKKVVTYDPVKDFSPISLVASQPFVLVLHPLAQQHDGMAEAQRVLDLLLAELPVKTAVKLAADISGAPRNALYQLALLKKQDQL